MRSMNPPEADKQLPITNEEKNREYRRKQLRIKSQELGVPPECSGDPPLVEKKRIQNIEDRI